MTNRRRISSLTFVSAVVAGVILFASTNDGTNSELRSSRRQLTNDDTPKLLQQLDFTRLDYALTINDHLEEDDPNFYAYIFIHYHKTGHHLSLQLRHYLVAGTTLEEGYWPLGRGRRHHDKDVGCPPIQVEPGRVYVASAPNFFCNTKVLTERLLDDEKKVKMGVKIIHLIRNPFDLALSNWVYHSQDPTPEVWVNNADPCKESSWFDQRLQHLVQPTLSVGDDPVIKEEDFDSLHNICTRHYQAQDSRRNWSFYTHLRQLNPYNSLLLATIHMMTGQGGSDIIRMANNIVKLKELSQQEKRIQVVTLSMEAFTIHPGASVLQMLQECAFPSRVKKYIAAGYDRAYYNRVNGKNKHMTNNKKIMNAHNKNIVEMKDGLKRRLRDDPLFGRILGNIERLVNDVELNPISKQYTATQ